MKIDWDKPLKTPSGHRAKLIYTLTNSPHPYVVMYEDTDGSERANGVTKHGVDLRGFELVMNATEIQSSWPANRDLLMGALVSMNCMKCGKVMEEDSSRQVNESTASITIYAKCSGCTEEWTLSFERSIKETKKAHPDSEDA